MSFRRLRDEAIIENNKFSLGTRAVLHCTVLLLLVWPTAHALCVRQFPTLRSARAVEDQVTADWSDGLRRGGGCWAGLRLGIRVLLQTLNKSVSTQANRRHSLQTTPWNRFAALRINNCITAAIFCNPCSVDH
jgi:hypothetical protein